MVPVTRLVAAVALAFGSVPLVGVGPAAADTASIVATNAGYFYSAGIDKPEQSPVAPPNVTASYADGVAAGNLAVAASGGQEEKVSFLYFDVFSLPEGAVVDKAVMTLQVVPNEPPSNISYQATADRVVACKAGDKGFSGDDGAGLALNAPERLCTGPTGFSAKGTAKSPTAWQWDITGLVKVWQAGVNDGVALTRGEDVASSFQQVFGPMDTATLDITFTPAVPVDTPSVPELPVVPDVPVPPAVPDAGGFVPAPDLGSAPVPTVPDPAVNPQPLPVAPQAGGSIAPVALSTSMTPTGAFWLGGLALAALLVLVSLVQGDPRVPVATGSRSRLSQALAERERASTSLRARPV